ncbi:hypothetical protein SETIT_3G156800v2 [Setaria italica]|uniref:DUF3741 domain-containing protein n=1 Tax=Setaria italica TaxID=4555 RepID=K3Z3K1_SETIT|nr:uncharacterized protein LOC101778360 [Setaria italica]RCV16675.1 hypothetical protein SETIT_3G156800v2 [Setaria italica]
MKSGSGGASAPSAGGSSLAIAERQKPAPSCVAALFQMFARRKLFSSSSKKSKLLPPVRATKFSPGRQAGGGEKTAAAKMRPLLLDSPDYSRSKIEGNGISHYPQPGQDRNCGENEMCAPGVVARLMGLSSMPAVNHQRPIEATDSTEFGDHRNSGPQDWSSTSRSIYTLPKKQQKTGQVIDDRRQDNGSLFNADTRPLWPRRHAHKVASPVKSPRSMSSRNKARLIEAAVKVLEPGLQSRNRRLSRRHAYLEYPCSSDDGLPGTSAVLRNVSDQFLRDMSGADAQRLGAPNIGATPLNNSTSNKWTEEDTGRKSIPFRRSDQNVPCQIQPEGNGKHLLISSSEKAGFEDSAKRTSNCVAVTNQDARKNPPRNMSQESARRGPLKQNNLKQNTLPVACREADPGCMVQRNKHRTGEQNATNTAQNFISLNKRMTDSKSLRSKRKELDRIGESHTRAENKNMATKGRQSSSLHSDTSNKLKLKTVTPKAMEKDMIIAKGAGLVSEKPKSASQNCARIDFQRQSVSCSISRDNKKSGIISFTSSSPVKFDATSLCSDNGTRTGTAVQGSPVGACPKRHSRRDRQNTYPQRGIVFKDVLEGISSLETAESVFFNQDELKNREIPGGRVVSSLFEKKGAVPVTDESLSDAQLWQRNSVHTVTYQFRGPSKPVRLHETHSKKHEANAKGCSPSPLISRASNKKSTTSILQSTYADDAFIPGVPLSTAETTFTDSHPTETCTPAASMQDTPTEKNSFSDPIFGQRDAQPLQPEVQDSKLKHPGQVTTTVELLLTNVRSCTRRESKEPSKTFLLRTIESALSTLTPGSKQDLNSIKAKEASSLRNLALDFVWDCLDSMCTQLCDSGYRSFTRLGLICTEERLAAEVRKEIARCSDMAGRGLDELAVSEVERAVEAGMGSMLEALQIGAQIEQDLVQELLNEIGLDMFRR